MSVVDQLLSPVSFFYKPPTSVSEDVRAVDIRQLRRNVGLIGMFLPFSLPLVLFLTNALVRLSGDEAVYSSVWLGSMSAYYYTVANTVFTGGLLIVGVYLFSYRGFDDNDQKAGNLAWLTAWMVALLPMNPPSGEDIEAVRNFTAFFTWSTLTGIIQYGHFAGAIGLFLTLRWFCLYSFTKTGGEPPSAKKLERNAVYRICGRYIGITLVLVVLTEGGAHLLQDTWPAFGEFLTRYNSLFWFEAIMVVSFGVAWFIKGEGVSICNLNDEGKQRPWVHGLESGMVFWRKAGPRAPAPAE